MTSLRNFVGGRVVDLVWSSCSRQAEMLLDKYFGEDDEDDDLRDSLNAAIKKRDLAAISLLLSKWSFLGKRFFKRALRLAARKGDTEIVVALLTGLTEEVVERMPYLSKAMDVACDKGHVSRLEPILALPVSGA